MTDMNSSSVRVGFIGTGRADVARSGKGYAMAHEHARGYGALPQCQLTACADIVEDNARAFADKFGVPGVYTSYDEMLQHEQLDIVSICTWPFLHAPMTIAACRAGVRAVHCEKPMALTLGDAHAMSDAAQASGTKLTFNHQRRFGRLFVAVKELVEGGAIGQLKRIEASCGDLYDFGTHWVDMMCFWNRETPGEWVMAQIDRASDKRVFGAPVETSAVCLFGFANGVEGLVLTGDDAQTRPAFTLHGDKGHIVVNWGGERGPIVELHPLGGAVQAVEVGDDHLHGPGYVERAIADAVRCLQSGEESQMSARHALHATEIVFGAYESSRRRGRVALPSGVSDSPLLSMIEGGQLPEVPPAE